MADIRTPLDPPVAAAGVNCRHCCLPLAAAARIDHGWGRSFEFVHADTGKRRCARPAHAEPLYGLDAIRSVETALQARDRASRPESAA